MSIDPKTPAQVTLNVFYNGSHHLAFGYNALMLVSYADGVYVFTGLGDAATATLEAPADRGCVRGRDAVDQRRHDTAAHERDADGDRRPEEDGVHPAAQE